MKREALWWRSYCGEELLWFLFTDPHSVCGYTHLSVIFVFLPGHLLAHGLSRRLLILAVAAGIILAFLSLTLWITTLIITSTEDSK